MIVASINLAIRPHHVGVCVIHDNTVEFPTLDNAVNAALTEYREHWHDDDGGNTQADHAAATLRGYLVSLEPQIIVVDSPQGFARPGRPARRAEQVLRTHGRTGPAFAVVQHGSTSPGTARLGIKVFNELSNAGYPRLEIPSLPESRCAIEVFPNSCWHSFGLDRETHEDLRSVQVGLPLTWTGNPNEHQLDAAVGALTAIVANDGKGVFVGHPFFVSIKQPREGYIVVPDPGRNWTGQP